MKKFLIAAAITALFAAASSAYAQSGGVSTGSVPEIDASMVGGGLALLGGAIVLLRSRRKR